MNIPDYLLYRRNHIYDGFVPKLTKEIYNLLTCYDEEWPYIEISNPEQFSLSYGEDGFCVVRIKATKELNGYKVFLDTGMSHQWEEVTYFPLLCAIFDSLSYMHVYRLPKNTSETECQFDSSKLTDLEE